MTKRPRFMTLADVGEELSASPSQMRALVKSGELPAIQIGGRGQWRVERAKLEDYIARMYEQVKKQHGSPTTEDHPIE